MKSRSQLDWRLMLLIDGSMARLRQDERGIQAAWQTLSMIDGRVSIQPIIRNDNGSGYIARDFGELIEHHGLVRHRFKPHCRGETGIMECANRTLRESLDVLELSSRSEAEAALKAIIANYNSARFHSAWGFKPPAINYRGNPAALDAHRALKLRQARHRRRQANLKLKRKTPGLSATEDIV